MIYNLFDVVAMYAGYIIFIVLSVGVIWYVAEWVYWTLRQVEINERAIARIEKRLKKLKVKK